MARRQISRRRQVGTDPIATILRRQMAGDLEDADASIDSKMGLQVYKKHTLMSTPRYDKDCWFPAVSITWRDRENFYFHRLDGPSKLCTTAEEAISHGLVLARLWVDKKHCL
jgi:hypothetical protein